MLIPLVVLAIGAVTAGYIDLPHFVAPVFRLEHAGAEHHPGWLPFAAGAGAVLAAIAGVWLYLPRQAATRERLARAFRPWARLAEKNYGFDAAYAWVVRRVAIQGSEALWKGVDVAVIDRTVVGTAAVVNEASSWMRLWQSGLVRGYALLILGGAVMLLGYLLWV